MDEPLSSKLLKIRVAMRAEIAKLHRRLRNNNNLRNHDQASDDVARRIVIMKDGFVQQIQYSTRSATNAPTVFVAGFIGARPNSSNVTLQDGVISNGKGLSLPYLKRKKLLKGYNGKN